jgi:hypothetical protein
MEQVAGWVKQNALLKNEIHYGAWTPVITAATGTHATLTYTAQTGRYTKMLDVVFYSGRIQINAYDATGASGDARFSLPLTVANQAQAQAPSTVRWSGVDIAASAVTVSGQPVQNTKYLRLAENIDNNATSFVQVGALATTDIIAFAGFYFAA